MHITAITPNFVNKSYGLPVASQKKSNINNAQNTITSTPKSLTSKQIVDTMSMYNMSNISFGASQHKGTTVPDIDFAEYKSMSEATKKRFRLKYDSFFNSRKINTEQLFDNEQLALPLKNEKTMDNFIKTASIYNSYKDQSIVCLGRSPKWFLNASHWMVGGIEKYTFAPFSDCWYRIDATRGPVRIDTKAPNASEIKSYRKMLKHLKLDPKTIVENFEKSGKKTIITDYIYSGKGMTSFLEVLGNFAKDQHVLENFSKAIQIVGIGSMDYMDKMFGYPEELSEPRVLMPEVLQPYSHNIKQKFYDMDYTMFGDMLLNRNTNECRSTYYPHSAWTIYSPDRFKVGMIKDMKKVENLVQVLQSEKAISAFSPAMRDYRNLLNFRILDGLNARGILKDFVKFHV